MTSRERHVYMRTLSRQSISISQNGCLMHVSFIKFEMAAKAAGACSMRAYIAYITINVGIADLIT